MKHLIKADSRQYKANLHCHSTISDGRLTPRELRDAYRAKGYSILAITDHEAPFEHTELSDDELLLLTGYEAYIRPNNSTFDQYSPELHINLLARDPHNTAYVNWNDSYCKYVKDRAIRDSYVKVGSMAPREYTVEYINDFLRVANENGYLCTFNHAYWSLEEQAMSLAYEGFFSMEMCNYSSYVMNRLEYNAQLYDCMLRHGKRIFCHSSDDNHNHHPFDSPRCDSFGGFTMLWAPTLDYPSVIAALERGDFYSSMGPTIAELTYDAGAIHVETSEAMQITLYYGSKNTPSEVGTLDMPVTHADFTLPDEARFFRIGVRDFEGRHADTRGFFRDELDD